MAPLATAPPPFDSFNQFTVHSSLVRSRVVESMVLGALTRYATNLIKTPFSGLGSVRTATKRAGGTVHNHGGSPGKRLGVKKFSDQYVIPGNIIVRQRGTVFHPGPHVKMGRDHTIYAVTPGYVRFYKEKWMRGQRSFVGLVMDRGEVLPRDEAARGRSRYCGLVDLKSRAVPEPTINP